MSYILAAPCFLFALLLHLAAAASPRLMDGVSFRCCTVLAEPLVYEDSTATEFGFSGITIEYIKRMQSELGFTCSSFKQYESDNVGFTSFIFSMDKCTGDNGTIIDDDPSCKCDIGAAAFAINTERIGRVDYVQPHVNDDYRVITHVDNTNVAGGDAFFLTSFSFSVWANIATLAAIFTFLKMLAPLVSPSESNSCSRRSNLSRPCLQIIQESRLPLRLRRASESTLYHMIGQTGGIECDSATQRQRILNFTILLSGLFLALVYEAGMTALLVRQSFQSEYRNVRDLQSCRIPPEDVCLPAGGSTQAFWETGIAVRPCHNQPGRRGPTLTNTYNEMIDLVVSKKCRFGVTGGSSISQAASGRYCQTLVDIGRPFFEGGLAMVLPRGSPWKQIMDNATLKLQSDGALLSVEDYLAQQGECNLSLERGLTFGRLRFFFLIAYIVCALLFVEMVVALCLYDKRKRESGEREGETGSENGGEKGLKILDGKKIEGSKSMNKLNVSAISPFSSSELDV